MSTQGITELSTDHVSHCTTCPYCGVGCGVRATTHRDGTVSIIGDEAHPANHGKLCLKGQSLAETLDLSGRLLHPIVDGTQQSWDYALDRIASQFNACIEAHGPESVAFYVSGQLLTEDYYAVNKFVKGYLGTANIDTNSRLCMASSVAGHKRAFGADTVPGCYDDLALADLVILVGSNLAWCHPVLHVRLSEAVQSNPDLQVITIDPRATATSALSDCHLQLAPDSDTVLFSGLLKWLVDHNAIDHDYIEDATSGIDAVLTEIDGLDVETVARISGLDATVIIDFFNRFTTSQRVVTVYSQGVNQSTTGTDKVNAIINCHLATGRIGKPGCGPFSITGQPNAMGGRETGGLANMLTCHMELENPEHRTTVQEYWQSPRIADKPGLKAVDLFRAIHDGHIRAIWIMATNPVVSMPDADFVANALRRCDFVVQSDVVMDNDTAAYAHVRLPAQAWSEKDGTVTNSERCISRQRRFREPPGETRPDWWALSQVASRLGYATGFDYQSPHQIFTEYARLSRLNNNGSRDFDISACADIDQPTYQALKPFYWPAAKALSTTPVRFFANGGYFTDDKKAKFVVTPVADRVVNNIAVNSRATDSVRNTRINTCASGNNEPSNNNWLRLNTGRVRDQWHTMTRTGTCHSLSTHTAEPFIEIHPRDADAANVGSADLATVSNDLGSCVLRVVVTDRVSAGSVFVPMHWCAPYANSARIGMLVDANTDPVSGQPALKHAFVRVAKAEHLRFGFAVTTNGFNGSDLSYFATSRCIGGWRSELAFASHLDIPSVMRTVMRLTNTAEVLECNDIGKSRYALAAFDGNRLHAICFIADEPVSASREWLASALTQDYRQRSNRHALLAAFPPAANADSGRLVCTCYGVGEKQICNAIVNHGCSTVADVGRAVCAGTNCGSCRGEINTLLKLHVLAASVA